MLPVDVLKQIALDLGLGREPVGYTPEMLEARERTRAELAEFRATKNPGAYIHLPPDIDGIAD